MSQSTFLDQIRPRPLLARLNCAAETDLKVPYSEVDQRHKIEPESETDLKVPYGEVNQRHKIEPESISVHPYISDSDINSNGEARKDYFLPDHPKPRGNPKDPIGAIVPNAFSKTSKTTGTSQIW